MADDTSISQQLDDVFEEFDDSPGSGRELTRSAFGAGTLMALVEREGVLYVEDEVGRSGVTRGASSHDEIVWQRCLSTPGRNQALEWLVKLDKKLTPIRGIRALRDGEWVATNDVASDGRTLLFVHGTFSNTDNLSGRHLQQRPRREILRLGSRSLRPDSDVRPPNLGGESDDQRPRVVTAPGRIRGRVRCRDP